PARGIRRPPLLKEVTTQVGFAAADVVGAYMTLIEEIPIRRADLCSPLASKVNARFLGLGRILPHFLSLVPCQAGQEIVVRGVAHILPVELNTMADHHARGLQ